MKVGDRVVCVETNNFRGYLGVKAGYIYVIQRIMTCKCGIVNFDIGTPVIDIFPRTGCMCGREFMDRTAWWQKSSRFRPIVFNSATEELANKEIVEERSDAPIKEPVNT